MARKKVVSIPKMLPARKPTRIKAPDISMKGPIELYKFKPLGFDNPVKVFLLNKKDFNTARIMYKHKLGTAAFSIWSKSGYFRSIYLTVDSIHLFAHELRHVTELSNFHKK